MLKGLHIAASYGKSRISDFLNLNLVLNTSVYKKSLFKCVTIVNVLMFRSFVFCVTAKGIVYRVIVECCWASA